MTGLSIKLVSRGCCNLYASQQRACFCIYLWQSRQAGAVHDEKKGG